MTTDTPRPERVTLTDKEREALACVATGHEPDLCDCCDAYRDNDDRFCEYAQETFAAVERTLAARGQALREELAGLADALREEADLAARPGQLERLSNIADQVDRIARR